MAQVEFDGAEVVEHGRQTRAVTGFGGGLSTLRCSMFGPRAEPASGFQGVAPPGGSSRAAKMHSELAKLKAGRRWVMSHMTSVSAVSGSLQSPP